MSLSIGRCQIFDLFDIGSWAYQTQRLRASGQPLSKIDFVKRLTVLYLVTGKKVWNPLLT
ncbi:MAG: hypothetical protein PUP91_01200 [Rhizonema sp. PD37]|nr:hypothetical protein [Rhizonema sp. PD37]